MYLSVLVSEDHDLGHRMLPILSSIARHSNPFFGFYVSGSVLDADLVPVDSREIEYLRALFEFPSFWGSLFFD
ncbi:MAG: hypothetical protein GWO27_21455, partial [Thermoplasmata archaeon]|nr:hypothetical protein [Thermoplasmata archaeon]